MRVCQRLKRVVVTPAVYPRFLNFFTLTFRALGTHCHDQRVSNSRRRHLTYSLVTTAEWRHVWNIECAQLHSELFRRRHSTRQSHGLFALAKHLSVLCQFSSLLMIYLIDCNGCFYCYLQLVFTQRRSVFGGVCLFVGLCVNTITSERVNKGWWNLGVGVLHKNLGQVRIWGS